MKRFLSVLALMSIMSASAQTYDYAKRIGIGGGVGFEVPTFKTGTDTGDKAGGTFNLHARYGLTSADSLSLGWDRTDLAKASPMADQYSVLWLRRMMPTSRMTPTFGAGLGLVNYTKLQGNADYLRLMAQLRAGLEYSFTQNLVGSFDVAVKYVNNAIQDRGDGSGNLVAIVPQINLTWFFGCGAACEKKAAPMAAAAVVAAKAIDGDADKDGVSDSKDKCPNSAAGATVNAYGCVAKEKAHIEVEVLFATSSAVVPAASHAKIQELADFLKEHSKTKAEIQGHTDSSGAPAKNKVLSQKRADAVKAYLVTKLGVDASRISSIGHGSEQPVADNKTVEGRAENRRVMAVIEE